MEDSDEEDPIEELCEYLDDSVGHYCEVENISAKDTADFYNICYEYKKRLRNGDIHPPSRPQLAFREILQQFDEYRVTQQMLNEDISSYKSKDPEWTTHVKSTLHELNDIFLKAKLKYPDMLDSRLDSHETPYKAITGTMKEFVLKMKKQETIPRDGEDLWKKYYTVW